MFSSILAVFYLHALCHLLVGEGDANREPSCSIHKSSSHKTRLDERESVVGEDIRCWLIASHAHSQLKPQFPQLMFGGRDLIKAIAFSNRPTKHAR